MQKLIVALAYCQKDHAETTRLLNWIKELDGVVDHHLLLVADDAVPMDTKKAIDALGKQVFTSAETIQVKAPAPVNGNYHVPAAVMFERAANQIDTCYKYNFLWLEPDAVPLKSGWMDTLAEAYDNCPKRFMGSIAKFTQQGVPPTVMFATAVYPNCAHSELKKFCDGTKAFDMAFSDYVVPRAQNTPLIFHAFGGPNDPPTFKEVKMPGDGPNVGTLDVLPKEAVLFHRNKDGSLIELLKKRLPVVPSDGIRDMTIVEKHFDGWGGSQGPMEQLSGTSTPTSQPPKRRPGRPPKQVPSESQMT